MKHKKIWLTVLTVTAMAMVAIFNQGGSRLQVQLRIEKENASYALVNAAEKGTISHMHGGDDEKSIRFRDGILKCGLPYGVTTVEGYFALEDIQKMWPDTPLTQNWEVCFSVFCTGNNGAKDIRISVICDTEENRAAATMYFFYDHAAEPIIQQWKGEIGERIAFALEV